MPKEKQNKKSIKLRHTPLGKEYEEKPLTNKSIKNRKDRKEEREEEEEEVKEEENVPEILGNQIFNQARDQRMEIITQDTSHTSHSNNSKKSNNNNHNNDSDSDFDVRIFSYFFFSLISIYPPPSPPLFIL